MKNQTAKLLAMGIGFVIALGVLPLVMADDNFDNSTVQVTLTENGYPAIAPSDYHFIPGDTLEVNMQVSGMADTEEDIFDIVICKVGETDHDKCKWFADNVTPDDNGEYHTTVSGDDTLFWSDDAYRVHIGDENYYDSRSIEISQGINWFNFNIQLYTIIAETDRTGYVPGDTVTVFYSIVSIKDGSLITEDAYEDSDFNGQWGVDSADGETKEGPNNFNDASGSFEFDINTDSDPAGDFDIGIWFNGTYGGDREGVEFLSAPWPDFRVDVLDLALSTDRTTYQLESVVKVSVNTIVQWAGPEPDVKVKIAILEGTGVDADEVDNYGGDEFYSDAQGNVFYAFSLDPDDFTEDETYTVRVNITKLGKKAGDEVTFDVKAGGRAISANMMFTKPVYTSGDTIDVEVETAVPAGADTDFTFIYKVKDGTGGTKAQEASSSSFFSYDVPDNFEGSLFFEVEVYNADGDFGSDSEWIEVHYAVILLNAEPQQYESGDTIEAEYTLESILMDNPTFFYKIRDSGFNIVAEGEILDSAETGSYEYVVPDVASSSYRFYIYANQDGVWVETFDTCNLAGGYDVEIWVDNPSYSPGDRVVIHYEINARGDEGLPDKFVFSYGMSNGPSYSWQSDSPDGDIFYELPDGVNEGDIYFYANVQDGDGNFIGSAGEILHIQESANPLQWVQFGGVALITWLLLILVIILIIMMLLRRPAAPAGAPPAEPEPEPVAKEEPVVTEGESPLAINCKSCGAEIEITTSKRPIEVMCPSCGETEMVE